MILVDTSVWIDHLKAADDGLAGLLQRGRILIHPFVLGEIALGNLRQRALVLDSLADLPRAVRASDEEVLGFIETAGLSGSGVGYVDAHLLAATRLTAGASFWTRDKRLSQVSLALGLSAPAP
ncbi:type II toxin-antitoxin system VapC family toxin [Microvirga brassicacearum]|uniref:Type II toxin-antitoxin system VapC family toxin n=1 Tax=Microvirga brassicacearum TaxID=2580413 RepID=A0A5N3PF80_9HYPH|nr:type II toxin-antitoxin system VapC family toxin [Microvirga brassicacearum]KAB0268373.1 type II toxin-antitoxin system VapC family toxin [Microvirga brassicacearum]